jgi:hypothetical protein
MPLIRMREPQNRVWRYVVICPPAQNPDGVIEIDKGDALPVPTAQKIIQAIAREEPYGEADGFTWQFDLAAPV